MNAIALGRSSRTRAASLAGMRAALRPAKPWTLRCVYCGLPTLETACIGHQDLLALDVNESLEPDAFLPGATSGSDEKGV